MSGQSISSAHRSPCRTRSGLDLGDEVLEIGPGPGLSTEALLPQVKRLTVIEIDEMLPVTRPGPRPRQ